MSSTTHDAVRERYARAARQALAGEAAGCGGSGGCCGSASDPISKDLYSARETSEVPLGASLASLGCGNPTALAQLHEGEVVLDLGSGGGIDVLLSARRVGPAGKAFGLDMTDEMLELANSNKLRSGAENVEFLKGEIEAIPLPDSSVDVIISNCVINLSADKSRVLREAYRVLRPGGRFAVSDIVARGVVPDAVRRDMELWTGCIAGALSEDEYRRLLRAAGFVDVEVEPIRVYRDPDLLAANVPSADVACSGAPERMFMSAFVRARKPRPSD